MIFFFYSRFRIVLYLLLSAIGVFSVMVMLSVLSARFNGGLMYAAVICLWLGILGTAIASNLQRTPCKSTSDD